MLTKVKAIELKLGNKPFVLPQFSYFRTFLFSSLPPGGVLGQSELLLEENLSFDTFKKFKFGRKKRGELSNLMSSIGLRDFTS